MTGGPSKEHGTNKPPLIGRVQKKWKEDPTCLTTSQNPYRWHPFLLSNECTTRKDSESQWLAKDNPETNPITINPETVGHVAEQSFCFPLPYRSLPGCPFPIKSLALSAHVSPWIVHSRALKRVPLPSTVALPLFPTSTHTYTKHTSLPTYILNTNLFSIQLP